MKPQQSKNQKTFPDSKLDKLILQASTDCFTLLPEFCTALKDNGLQGEFQKLQNTYESSFFARGRTVCGSDEAMWRYLVVLHRQNYLRGKMLAQRTAVKRLQVESDIPHLLRRLHAKTDDELAAIKAEEANEEARRDKATQKRLKASGRARPGERRDIDWTLPHTTEEFLLAMGIAKSIHGKKIRQVLRAFDKARNRPPGGAHHAFRYPFEAGIKLLNTCISEWLSTPEERARLIFLITRHQASLATASGPECQKLRRMLHGLWNRYCSGQEFPPVWAEKAHSLANAKSWRKYCARQKPSPLLNAALSFLPSG